MTLFTCTIALKEKARLVENNKKKVNKSTRQHNWCAFANKCKGSTDIHTVLWAISNVLLCSRLCQLLFCTEYTKQTSQHYTPTSVWAISYGEKILFMLNLVSKVSLNNHFSHPPLFLYLQDILLLTHAAIGLTHSLSCFILTKLPKNTGCFLSQS